MNHPGSQHGAVTRGTAAEKGELMPGNIEDAREPAAAPAGAAQEDTDGQEQTMEKDMENANAPHRKGSPGCTQPWRCRTALDDCRCASGQAMAQQMAEEQELLNAARQADAERREMEKQTCQDPDGCAESSYGRCPADCNRWMAHRLRHHPDDIVV
jgi:hypothetical protein